MILLAESGLQKQVTPPSPTSVGVKFFGQRFGVKAPALGNIFGG
jgi:hypothetical protein